MRLGKKYGAGRESKRWQPLVLVQPAMFYALCEHDKEDTTNLKEMLQ